MIKINDQVIDINHFPDGTLLLKENAVRLFNSVTISWFFESNEELVALIYLTKHLREHDVKEVNLFMPYIPNARMDRVKHGDEVFTLKYFADVINSLNFDMVLVIDPHSSVSAALINKIIIEDGQVYMLDAIYECNPDILFYPDEGAMKRYSSMIKHPYAFGIKRRNWETGNIEGLDVAGEVDQINGKNILIVDDICSRGGTFLHSAKKLKELGANKIYLYVTHCENTILEGDLLTSGLIEKAYTTNSIFTKEHEKIEVFEL